MTPPRFFNRWLLFAVVVGSIALFMDQDYYYTLLNFIGIHTLLVVGLNLLLGYAGQISLGHAAFFGLGAYTSGILTATCGVDPWLALMAGLAVSGAAAFLIGIPALKLRGYYLAMATLGFGTIVYRVFLAMPLFGEADGISAVPPFPLLPGVTVSGDFAARTENYYIAFGLLIVGLLFLINLVHSRIGRAFRAIHGSEEAANAMGINTPRLKLQAFVISAVFAALAGVFLTHYNGGIGPSEASVMKSIRYVAIVAVGGMASLWGVFFMGILLNFMSLRGMFGTYDDAVFGVILILIMLFAPNGLLRLHLWQRMRRWRGVDKPKSRTE